MITKLIYLIFAKLKSMVARDVFFFLILAAGVITCNLMFVYGYGIMMQVTERDGLDDFMLYGIEPKAGISDFENALEGYSAEIYYYLPIEKEQCSEEVENDLFDGVRCIRTSHNIFQTNVSTGNINNLKQPGTVIIPEDIKGNIGDEITLNGKSFRVVGSSISDDFEVSPETFDASGFIPAMVSVDVPARKVKGAGEALRDTFGADYSIKQQEAAGLDESSKGQLALIAAVYLLCVFSFLYIFVSIYDDAAYELNVYEILGASRGHTVAILGGVMLVFLSAVNLLSQLIHRVFYKSFFSRLNVVSNYDYTAGDYLIMFFATLGSVFAVVLLYIAIRTRRSAIANSRSFSQ